ncbi:MAG: membrane protein [Bryobacteraceae bacterium]|nr:MAG: membrane protein [Bryobacteraceae bacterium]
MTGDELGQVQERLDAISKALARLSRRVDEIEARLAALPQLAPPPPPPWPEPAAPSDADVVQEPAAAALPETRMETAVPPPAQTAPAAAEPVESSFGLSWLNRIGVVTLVLGVAFLFKYAIDNEWIGPRGRVALGVAAGIAALAAADRLSRTGQRVFAMGITALGISVLYVSSYAAYGFYQLAPVALSFAAMMLVTASAAWLALRYDASSIAVLSLIGGFATPLVLSTGRDAPWVLFPYLLLLVAGAVWVRRRRGWSTVEWLALLGAAALYELWFLRHFETAKRAPAAFFLLSACALFHLSPSAAARQVAHVGAAVGIAFVFQPDSSWLFAILIPLTGVGLLRNMGAAAAAGFWLPYSILAGVLNPDEAFWIRFAGVTAGFGLIHAWALWQRGSGQEPGDWTAPMVYAVNAVAWYASAYALLEPEHQLWTGAFTFAAGALLAASAWVARRTEAIALLSGVLATAFFTLAVPIQFQAWRVTVAWVLEGVLLAFLASRFPARLPHWIAAVVLSLALLRVAFVDSNLHPQMLFINERFFVMVWAALGCWISAALLQPRFLAAASYVAGHAVMLAGMELEVIGQVRRTALPENLHSASILAFSLVLGAYGVALVALGMARRARLDRALGLLALGFVVLKLYLYDVWQLGRLFRSTAFVGLGLLLVAASYLYSRHRERLSKWLG